MLLPAVDGSHATMVTLGPTVPAFVGHALRRLPGVTVIEGAPETSVLRQGNVEVVVPEIVDVREVRARLAGGRRGLKEPHALLAVRGAVDDRTAARLEDLGIGFADIEGRAWLAGTPRSVRARARSATSRQLRPESLRLAQLLADHPAERWTQRSLAARGGSTQVTAQRLLRRLEDEGVVVREGGGRTTERTVPSPAALRRWLLENARPERTVRLPFFVSDPTGIPEHVGDVHLALTGSLAAERLGVPVTTSRPSPTFRADCGPERLEDLPALLGGFRTNEGATATLIADPGRLGHVDARRLGDGTLVAPPSRVMLDLLLESRGAATAELFAEVWRDDR
jgi:hypothetical protein